MFYAETIKFNEKSATLISRGPYKDLIELFEDNNFQMYQLTTDINVRYPFVERREFDLQSFKYKLVFERIQKWRVVNKKGVILSINTLQDWRNRWVALCRKNYIPKWLRAGRSRPAYGQWRHPKTLNELRQNLAVGPDALFYGAKVRSKRKHLPTVWDDRYSHNDKSWKTQSKRKHQWKPK